MKKAILLFMGVVMTISLSAQSELKVFEDWSTTVGTQHFFYKNVTKTDGSGNVYVAGATMNAYGNYDILVTKYDNGGKEKWVRQINGAGNYQDFATAICLTDSNEVYITGAITDDSTLFMSDILALKLNATNGSTIWMHTVDGAGSAFDCGTALVAGDSGYVYIAGSGFNGSYDLDFMVLKYSSNGTVRWATSADYVGMDDAAVNMYLDGNKLFILGAGQTSATDYDAIGGGINVNTLSPSLSLGYSNTSSSGVDVVNDLTKDIYGNYYVAGGVPTVSDGYDMYLVKLDSNLVLQWEVTYNGTDDLDDIANGVKVDSAGNVYITGFTTSTTERRNCITIQYDNTGSQQWAVTYNDTLDGDDEGISLELDQQENVIITGYDSTAINHLDYYTIKYDDTGAEIWNIRSDGSAHLSDRATNMAIDNAGNIIVTGESKKADGSMEYKTVKYVEKEIVNPTDFAGEPTPSSFLYYKNKGQLIGNDSSLIPQVHFYTKNTHPAYYFSNDTMSMVFSRSGTDVATDDTLHRIDLAFDNTNENLRVYSLEEQKTYLNYFLAHCPNGITEIYGNKNLIVPDIYDKIDLVYSSNQNGFKYYFVVKQGGNPDDIIMQYTGASSTNLSGNILSIRGVVDTIKFDRPFVYQIDASNDTVTNSDNYADWQNNGGNNYSFDTHIYDSTKVFIIQVDQGNTASSVVHAGTNHEWESYFGGQGDDEGTAVSTDNDGNAYFAGKTNSTFFPILNGFQTATNGLYYDAYIARFNAVNYSTSSGDDRKWVTYFGGGNEDYATGIVAVGSGSAGKNYIVGKTQSADLPLPTINAGTYKQTSLKGSMDAFIIAFDNNYGGISGSGSAWVSYFGGNGEEVANCIAKDVSGNIYVGGQTSTGAYSATTCAVPADNGLPYCNPNGQFENGGSYGGSSDGFVAKFSGTGTLQWSTYFGGDEEDEVKAIAVDASSNVFIGGKTAGGSGFPFPSTLPSGKYNQTTYGGGTSGEYDGFIAKFNATQVLQWSTFFGGDADDQVLGIDIDVSGNDNLFITGKTSTQTPACPACTCAVPTTGQFPLCDQGGSGEYNTTNAGGYDAFLARFTNTGQIQWSTFYGGDGDDEATGLVCDEVDYLGGTPNVIITGETRSSDFHSQSPFGTISGGAGYLYPDAGSDDIMDVTAYSDSYLAMFTNTGIPLWSTNYGDPGQGGYDRNNAITSTKSISSFALKQIYATGYSAHADHEQVTSNYLTDPYGQQPAGGAGTINITNRDAVNSRFGYSMYFVGISENIPEINELLIYPNPSSDNIIVQGTLKDKAISMKIYDILGKEIYKVDLPSENSISFFVDISKWQNGIYIVQLISEQSCISKKIIKQ